jgi:hypothetical protein
VDWVHCGKACLLVPWATRRGAVGQTPLPQTRLAHNCLKKWIEWEGLAHRSSPLGAVRLASHTAQQVYVSANLEPYQQSWYVKACRKSTGCAVANPAAAWTPPMIKLSQVFMRALQVRVPESASRGDILFCDLVGFTGLSQELAR